MEEFFKVNLKAVIWAEVLESKIGNDRSLWSNARGLTCSISSQNTHYLEPSFCPLKGRALQKCFLSNGKKSSKQAAEAVVIVADNQSSAQGLSPREKGQPSDSGSS